jgi:hypothetical protein
MDIQHIALEIDAEISRLQQARALLAGTETVVKPKPRRPAGASLLNKKKAVRTLSAEARAKIAAAQKARWAKSKRAAKKEARNAVALAVAKKASSAGVPVNTKAGRTLSAESRVKMAAAQKARWAKVRKDAKKRARNAAAASATKKAAPAKVAKKSTLAKKAPSVKRDGASEAMVSAAPTPGTALTS